MRAVTERVPRLVTIAHIAATMAAAGTVEAVTGGAGGRLAAWWVLGRCPIYALPRHAVEKAVDYEP